MTLWLVLAGILLIAEMATGTFYLLMISAGALLGALVASAGYPLESQILAAAILTFVACIGLQKSRFGNSAKKNSLQVQSDKLDIGNTLHVAFWDTAAHSKVQYRGTLWDAKSIDVLPAVGLHVVVDVQGNLLVLKLVSNQ